MSGQIESMAPLRALPPMITFAEGGPCEKGETAAKTGCTPAGGDGGKDAGEGFEDRVGDQAESYKDIAPYADPGDWAGYMEKFGYTAEEAEDLRQQIIHEEKEESRAQASRKWEEARDLAFRGEDMAGDSLAKINPGEASVSVAKGLERVGGILGGLERDFPQVRAVVQAGLIGGVVWSDRKGSGHSATYNPVTKQIEIGAEEIITPATVAHEIGHAVESVAPDGWGLGESWRDDGPSASMYAAQGDPGEKFAEGFVRILEGDGFDDYAPAQARQIRKVLESI